MFIFILYSKGQNLEIFSKFNQIQIWLGKPKRIQLSDGINIKNEQFLLKNCAICTIKIFIEDNILCQLPSYDELSFEPGEDHCNISVWIGFGTNSNAQLLGFVNYCRWNIKLIISIIIAALLLIILLTIAIIIFRKCQKNSSEEEIKLNMDELTEFTPNAFSNLSLNLSREYLDHLDSVPNENYTNFILKTFSLNENYLTELNQIGFDTNLQREFLKLILEEEFLLHLISFFEDYHFPLMDKICLANYLVLVLSGKHLSYLTKIMLKLLEKLIDVNATCGKSKLVLIRTETIVERIVIAWLTILLYEQITIENGFSTLLYKLYYVLREYCHLTPVDDLTKNAYHTLSYDKLLRNTIKFKQMNIQVSLFNKFTIECEDSDDENNDDKEVETELDKEDHTYEKLITRKELTRYNVNVLDTDTINQVIKKSLNVIYGSTPYSKQEYKFFQLNLQQIDDEGDGKILSDYDKSSKKEKYNSKLNWCQLNTMAHYQITDGQYFLLIPKSNIEFNDNLFNDFQTLQWHIDRQVNGKYCSINRPIPDLMLNRLTMTKAKIQPFMDDLFKFIFQQTSRKISLDLSPIKFLFDYFDRQANRIRIGNKFNEPGDHIEISHTWKSNTLYLRFWANIIANPHFILDIKRDSLVECNLNTISQILMKSSSFQLPKINENSPIEWFLYSDDFIKYNKMIHKYFSTIKEMDEVLTDDLDDFFHQYSKVQIIE